MRGIDGWAAAALLVAGVWCAGAVLRADSDPVLAATESSQRIQNVHADADDLSRLTDRAMLARFRRARLLVPVAAATSTYYLHRIAPRRRYLRPWAKLFLTRLSREFHTRFGGRLRITALVRTAAYQRTLSRSNPNAAPATGAETSSHLTGATLDISKRFMKPKHAAWVRRVLYQLRERGVLYAVEEFHQPCFHVMVFKRYRTYVRGLTS
ncbi:MAG TPA: DUF5715 family protein [Vicinamibacterales bacterium]|nr:DUF5715 family protein [Vicinamibacterales bacterium]